MVEMTMTIKTFKQYSKDSKEDKGYYINKDGVAVILEPIGNHRINRSKKKNIKESYKPNVESGAPMEIELRKHGGRDMYAGSEHFEKLHKEIAKNTGDVTKETKEAINNYSNGSYNLNNHLIHKHMVKHGKPVPKDHWKHLGQAKKDKNGNKTPYKDNIDHWEKEHSHLMKGFRKAGTHVKLFAGVSARTHNALKDSKDGVIEHVGYASVTPKLSIAKAFAENKKSDKSNTHYYNVYHTHPDDEVLHMQPHSNMKEEEEFGIKPGSHHKHFKTTRHTDEDGNTHIFNHFKSHNESK